MSRRDDMTVPHLTRRDSFKTGLYVFFALLIAVGLIAMTVWLFSAG